MNEGIIERNEPKSPVVPARSRKYLVFLISVAILYDIFDSFVTNIPNVINDFVIDDFHITPDQYAFALGFFSLGTFFALVSQSVADRVGRKPMLFIAFLGMGVTCFSLSFTQNIIQFSVAAFFMYVFFSSDIWTIMVSEDGPKDARARLVTIVLTFGAIGSLLTVIFRDMFGWRGATWFGIVAIPCAFICLFTKETKAYEILKQQRKQGVKKGTQRVWNKPFQKSYRTTFVGLMAVAFIVGLNYLFITMGVAYLKERGFTDAQRDMALLILTISAVIGFLVTGVLADKVGRKVSFYLFTSIMITGIFVTLFGSGDLVYVGIFLFGMSIWGSAILSRVLCMECFPTDIRGASAGWRTLFFAAGSSAGAFIASALIPLIKLSGVFFVYSLILVITIPLIWRCVSETRGCKLEEVT